jgi:hypothetical protein
MVCPLMLVTTSPGFTARPPGMFSQAGISPTTLIFRLEFGERPEHTQDAGGTAHVELHLVHFRRRLDRNATRVERDALAHQNTGASSLGSAGVAQLDELQGLSDPCATARTRPCPAWPPVWARARCTRSFRRPGHAPLGPADVGVAWLAGTIGPFLGQFDACKSLLWHA